MNDERFMPGAVTVAAAGLTTAHRDLVEALAAHLEAGGTWDTAWREFQGSDAVQRLGVRSRSAFHRRFSGWVRGE